MSNDKKISEKIAEIFVNEAAALRAQAKGQTPAQSGIYLAAARIDESIAEMLKSDQLVTHHQTGKPVPQSDATLDMLRFHFRSSVGSAAYQMTPKAAGQIRQILNVPAPSSDAKFH